MNERSLAMSIFQRFMSLAPFQFLALLVGAGLLTLLNLEGLQYLTHKSQQMQDRIDRSWSVAVVPSEAEDDKIGRQQAIMYLYEQGESLQLVDLSGASLRGTNLPGANLRMAILERAILENANLRGANLWRAVLNDAHLSGATLRDISLKGALLKGARLDHTDLTGGNLTQADLTGADLRGARVTMDQLAMACANPRSPPMVDKDVRPPMPWPRPCSHRKWALPARATYPRE